MKKKLSKRQKVYRILMYIFGIFPINNKKIVVTNYYGKGYGDNGKYIIEELLRQNQTYKIIWLIDKSKVKSMPASIIGVQIESIKALYHLSTAKIWLDNCRKSVYTRKRKAQFYIQTWHGSIGLKKCEKDVEDKLGKEYVQNCKYDSQIADRMLSGSKWGTEVIKRAFWYSGEILEFGLPRIDIFFRDNSESKKKVLDTLNIKNKKIVLYAPTFRNDFSLDAYKLNYATILNAIELKFGGEFVLLIRLHPNMSEKSKKLAYSKNIIDVTEYPDMQELLVASDILLSDYSSSPFEYMFTKKPIFLIAKDYLEYKENEREFYFNLEELPFPLSITEEDLVNQIACYDERIYHKKLEKFFEELGIVENGCASKKIVEIIRDICESNNKSNGSYRRKTCI